MRNFYVLKYAVDGNFILSPQSPDLDTLTWTPDLDTLVHIII